jgi:hypothetical protein
VKYETKFGPFQTKYRPRPTGIKRLKANAAWRLSVLPSSTAAAATPRREGCSAGPVEAWSGDDAAAEAGRARRLAQKALCFSLKKKKKKEREREGRKERLRIERMELKTEKNISSSKKTKLKKAPPWLLLPFVCGVLLAPFASPWCP